MMGFRGNTKWDFFANLEQGCEVGGQLLLENLVNSTLHHQDIVNVLVNDQSCCSN